MPAAMIAQLIISVGLPLTQQLIALYESNANVTSTQFNALVTQYGTKSAASYLADAQTKLFGSSSAIIPATPSL